MAPTLVAGSLLVSLVAATVLHDADRRLPVYRSDSKIPLVTRADGRNRITVRIAGFRVDSSISIPPQPSFRRTVAGKEASGSLQ